jgi:uncharacterized protein
MLECPGMLLNKLTPILLLFLLVHITAYRAAPQEIHILTPSDVSYLRDDVGLLSLKQRERIISLLERHNKKSQGRIYLDIIPHLPTGKTIEQYARERLNTQPSLASEKADKIMLVVALENKIVRIETSRDVWEVLTDEYCHRVNREIMIPKFKTGDYYSGIEAGIKALIEKLEKTD